MNRRLGLVGVPIVVAAAFGAWWVMSTAVSGASGFHVVDGYWLGPESTCTDANAPDYCGAAIQAATEALEANLPGAVVVRTAIAAPSCDATTYVVCMTAGLSHPFFVVFDLGDGSRLPVGVGCRGTVTQGGQVVSAPACAPELISNQEAGSP